MEEADQITQNLEIVSLHYPAPAERACLSLVQGDVQKAARWVEERRLDDDDKPSYARELEYLVLARTLLNRNLSDRALSLLEHLEAGAKAQERVGSLIEIQVLQALAFQASGKADQAIKALAQALMQAEPDGYIRICMEFWPKSGTLTYTFSQSLP